MSIVMKKIRQNVAGSLKKIMPTITVPATNPAIHSHHCAPSEFFARPRQNVKPTSHSPASIKIIQFIFC